MGQQEKLQGERPMTEAVQVFREQQAHPAFSAETIKALKAGLAPGSGAPTHEHAARAQNEQHRFGDLYGASPAMRELFGLLERVAPSRAIVLIKGESGTGKELVASTLHKK